MKATVIDISKRIQLCIEEFAKNSRKDFAAASNISYTGLTAILNGSKPSSDKIEGILKAYPISAHWLLTGEGEMERVTNEEYKVDDEEYENTVKLLKNLAEEGLVKSKEIRKLQATINKYKEKYGDL